MRFPIAAAACVALSCASTPEGTIQLVTGGESDTMTRAPAPTSLLVEAVDASGTATQLAKVALPTSSIDLGNQSQDSVAVLRVTGFDGSGTARVRGSSVPVQLGGLEGATLTLYVQRAGELARLPTPLDARPQPLVASVEGRYMLVAGGTDASVGTSTAIYDFGTFAGFPSPPTLKRTPRSLAMYGTLALFVDDAGAWTFDLSKASADATADAPLPTGGSFAEVSGGATVVADDGTAYVVGATRTTGDPTPRVLVLGTKGDLTFAALATPRRGAAAAWVKGRGLVVAGGSASGAGVEILAPGATTASPLAFPSDATTGAGAAALDGKTVLLAGGLDAMAMDAKLRVVDLTCASSCAPTAWTSALPTPLARAQAFALGDGGALVVGDDAMGATHVARVAPATAAEVPLKAARSGARAVVVATGAIAVVGGGAQVVETFVP